MSNPNNDPQSQADQMANTAKNAGKKIGGKIVNKGKNMAKNALKKAGKKALAKIGKIAVKILAKIAVMALPYIVPIMLVATLAIFGYYIMYEIKGSQQMYVNDEVAENATEKDDKNVKRTSASLTSAGTKEIQQFYNYMSQHSFWQILGDDNEKLEQKGDEIYDYYLKEQDYLLNSNLLYSLDSTMHKSKFIYPEQFVKPVNYDPEKLELAPLTDEEGEVIVESEEYDEEGKKTGKKVKRIADYGIASIFKYKKAQKQMTIEGTMYKKDVWDTSCNCKKTVDTDEPFSYTMEGYPEEIHLMTKAITFVGEYTFSYKDEKTKQSELTDNAEPGNASDAVAKVQVGTGTKMKTVHYTEIEIDANGNEVTVEKTRQEVDEIVPLYGYRKGGIYQTIPVLEKTDVNDKGQDYLNDYLNNYKIYTPESVLDEFHLEDRGLTSGFESTTDLTNLSGGSGVGSAKFQKALQYFPIIETYANMYGVDKYIVLAKMTQESGGEANINDGLMQITGDGARTVSAVNVNGQKDTFTVYNEADRRNPELAIRWGVMYFANLQAMMDGDPLKALQSYNFGEGGVLWIKKNYPESWNSTAWMNYREDSRLHFGGSDSKSASYDCIPDRAKSGGKTYGDSCYVEHVLQYYAGGGVENTEMPEEKNVVEKALDNVADATKNIFTAVYQNVTDAVSRFVKSYEEEEVYKPYVRYVSDKDIKWTLDMVIAMDNYKLFSEVESDESTDELNFWNKGFNSQVANPDKANFTPTNDVAGFQVPYSKTGARLTSLPGYRTDPVYGGTRYHAGTDIALPKNTPIYATADGTVTKTHAGETDNNGAGLGNHVKITHENGIISTYGHLTSFVVKQGQEVTKGQLIGYSGTTGKSTGPHLHFEIRQNGIIMDSSLICTGTGTKLVPAP